jgi:hypothetical protein
MRQAGLRSCASVVVAVFLSAVLLGPSRADAAYRDNSDDLKFGGGTGLVLVAVGIAVVTLVTVLVVRHNRAKPPPAQGALLDGPLAPPELRVADDFLVRAGAARAPDLRLAEPFAGAQGLAPQADAGALALRF